MVAVIWLVGAAILLVGAARSFYQGWLHQGLFRLVLAWIAIGLAGGNLVMSGYDYWLFHVARDPATRLLRAVPFAFMAYYSVTESWHRIKSNDSGRGGKSVYNDTPHRST